MGKKTKIQEFISSDFCFKYKPSVRTLADASSVDVFPILSGAAPPRLKKIYMPYLILGLREKITNHFTEHVRVLFLLSKTQRTCCAGANPNPAVHLTQNELSKTQANPWHEVLVEAEKTEVTS